MCQNFLISLLSRIRGVGDRNSRYVFSTAFASVVENCVAFQQLNRLKNNAGEMIVRQVKDSLKYCVQGTVVVRLADREAA